MKNLEKLLISLPLILNSCAFSIKENKHNNYVEEEAYLSSYQKVNNQGEPIIFYPIVILKLGKDENKKYNTK